jgi:hypothetical protein
MNNKGRKRSRKKLTTAYIVKMTLFWTMWIVLGIAVIMKFFHVFKLHILN